MSKHYVNTAKYSHSKRKAFFTNLVNQGKAEILEKGARYFLVSTLEHDYRISSKGIPIKLT